MLRNAARSLIMKKKVFVIFPKILANGKKIYYYSTYDENGKRRQFSTGCTDEIEATKYVLDLFQKGTLVKNTNLAFDKYAANFFSQNGNYVSSKLQRGFTYSKTYSDKNNAIINKRAIPFFKNKTINLITPKDIEAWLKREQQTGISNSTLNKRIKILRIIFNEAYRLGDISFNPFTRIQMFCSDTKTKGIFTEDEIRKLFKSTSSKCLWKNDLTYLFNLLAVSTGMRLGEIQALRVEDLSKGLITVRHSYDVKYGLKETKTNTVRQIPITMELYKSILKFLSWRNNGYIFSFNNGVTPISRNYIYKDFYSAMEKIGLSRNKLNERNISFHSYRHTFASILANKNLPELFIRKLTGHASQEVFNGYTHIELEELQKALA